MKKEERVKFNKGMQRKFLDLAIVRLNCNSLRSILQFGFEVPYSTLKNYYTERRLIPKNFYFNLCRIAKIDSNRFKVKFISGNWGQIKGGSVKKRKSLEFFNKK